MPPTVNIILSANIFSENSHSSFWEQGEKEWNTPSPAPLGGRDVTVAAREIWQDV
jgi:hypothetical protein